MQDELFPGEAKAMLPNKYMQNKLYGLVFCHIFSNVYKLCSYKNPSRVYLSYC